MAEAVDHGGGQQHADNAQDGHDGEDEELGGLGLAVLGGDLVDLAPLHATKKRKKGVDIMFILLPVRCSEQLKRQNSESSAKLNMAVAAGTLEYTARA